LRSFSEKLEEIEKEARMNTLKKNEHSTKRLRIENAFQEKYLSEERDLKHKRRQ
jgi:hypothetical protein